MGKAYRIYREGFPHHTFTRGKDGNVIFYSTADCLFFTTLYSCLARRYRISVRGFTIMPNHVHSNESSPDKETFLLFHSRLNSEFTLEYNRIRGRNGQLMEERFGYAAKTAGKRIRDNLCYIANNAYVGKLSDDVLGYRWNLIAYRLSDHPFSEKIDLKHSSRTMKRAVAKVLYFRRKDLPMTYIRQHTVMEGLSARERKQIIDYIISKYNCLDYQAMEVYYQDSFENALLSFKANSGSEHDIPEDFENYGIYARMIRLANEKGIDLGHVCLENTDPNIILRLANIFRIKGFPMRQIRRFLHIREVRTT